MPKFVKVMPHDYKRVLEAFAQVKAEGLTGDEAVMAAFESKEHTSRRWEGIDGEANRIYGIPRETPPDREPWERVKDCERVSPAL